MLDVGRLWLFIFGKSNDKTAGSIIIYYNISLTWIAGPFGDDFPEQTHDSRGENRLRSLQFTQKRCWNAVETTWGNDQRVAFLGAATNLLAAEFWRSNSSWKNDPPAMETDGNCSVCSLSWDHLLIIRFQFGWPWIWSAELEPSNHSMNMYEWWTALPVDHSKTAGRNFIGIRTKTQRSPRME